jgi:hypothetical protein
VQETKGEFAQPVKKKRGRPPKAKPVEPDRGEFVGFVILNSGTTRPRSTRRMFLEYLIQNVPDFIKSVQTGSGALSKDKIDEAAKVSGIEPALAYKIVTKVEDYAIWIIEQSNL